MPDLHGKTTRDYLYCSDCKTFVDLWAYDSIDDTGHADCNWRHVTEDELDDCVGDCAEFGCFEEVFI